MSCVPPRGAFYAFPRIEVPEDDATWVKQLLLEKHILTVQGSGFGQKPGSKHFRIVFLPQEEMLRQAYSEIRDFMTRRV
jgi:alanine-synthesizing transaminase